MLVLLAPTWHYSGVFTPIRYCLYQTLPSMSRINVVFGSLRTILIHVGIVLKIRGKGRNVEFAIDSLHRSTSRC